MTRYDQLLTAIDLFKPTTIVEIGTWNGYNAVRMIKQAQKHRKNVKYIGFDLFEEASDETDSEELNLKKHFTVEDVWAYIEKECPGTKFNLIKGNTNDTLTSLSADFVFIDGGHSIETIEHDYNAVKGSSCVIFDDYYVPDSAGACPDINIYGCNLLVGSIVGARVLPIGSEVKTGGINQMVMVLGAR